MQIDDGLSEGNLGGLFSFWPSLLSFCSRLPHYGRGLCPLAALIPPLLEKILKRRLSTFFQP